MGETRVIPDDAVAWWVKDADFCDSAERIEVVMEATAGLVAYDGRGRRQRVASDCFVWLEPVATRAEVAALRAEVASLQARISDFEKYTEIMCPDCGAPTDGLPEGWPAS